MNTLLKVGFFLMNAPPSIDFLFGKAMLKIGFLFVNAPPSIDFLFGKEMLKIGFCIGKAYLLHCNSIGLNP